MIHAFVKDGGQWYIDLPEFLEMGLGTRGNLMMVAGADTFLDFLDEKQENRVTIHMDTEKKFKSDKSGVIRFQEMFMDPTELEHYNHPEVEFGANYLVTEYRGAKFNHRMWLCPVTQFVFGGEYPKIIYFKVLKNPK
jgi:hypothetical protein